MRLLLDTSVLIPILLRETDQLARPLQEMLRRAEAAQFASVVSLWEISIKTRVGKLALGEPLASVPATLEAFNIELLWMSPEQAITEPDPVPPTRDPFDRQLLAICAVERLRLLTTDRALKDHPLAWRPDG